jgi:hypothetical protein
MKDKTKNILLWAIAVVITLILVIYQRVTGPTYPVKGKVEIGSETIKFKLLRTYDTGIDAPVEIMVNDKEITGQMSYRRFRSYDEWTTVDMQRMNRELTDSLPSLPPAGKMMYKIVLYKNGISYNLTEDPVVLRYKGAVPMAILSPHIFFMFISFLFGVRAGLEALFRKKDTRFQAGVALFAIAIGGLLLGPLVQKYAFDAFWTGWPFGEDLTDNKTAAIFIFWLIAWLRLRKKPEHKTWVIVALIAMIIVYIIPHSVLGSEIDYTKQQTQQMQQNSQ